MSGSQICENELRHEHGQQPPALEKIEAAALVAAEENTPAAATQSLEVQQYCENEPENDSRTQPNAQQPQKCENEPDQLKAAIIIARRIREADLARKRAESTGDSPGRQNDRAA